MRCVRVVDKQEETPLHSNHQCRSHDSLLEKSHRQRARVLSPPAVPRIVRRPRFFRETEFIPGGNCDAATGAASSGTRVNVKMKRKNSRVDFPIHRTVDILPTNTTHSRVVSTATGLRLRTLIYIVMNAPAIHPSTATRPGDLVTWRRAVYGERVGWVCVKWSPRYATAFRAAFRVGSRCTSRNNLLRYRAFPTSHFPSFVCLRGNDQER